MLWPEMVRIPPLDLSRVCSEREERCLAATDRASPSSAAVVSGTVPEPTRNDRVEYFIKA